MDEPAPDPLRGRSQEASEVQGNRVGVCPARQAALDGQVRMSSDGRIETNKPTFVRAKSDSLDLQGVLVPAVQL